MKNKSTNSRRDFIKKSTLAAAGTVGFLSLDWQQTAAHEFARKVPSKPKPGQQKIHHIPLELFGLNNVPAIPFVVDGMATTLLLLSARSYEVLQARNGLNNTFTIQGQSATGYAFLFGRTGASGIAAKDNVSLQQLFENSDIETILGNIQKLLEQADRSTITLSDDPITGFSLDDPSQFALSVTTFYNIYQRVSTNLLASWTKSLTDVSTANKAFWPSIAKYGMSYHLLYLQKVNHQQLNELKDLVSPAVANHYDLDQLSLDGNLFVIDLTIFNTVDVNTVEGAPRFTPGTYTLLEQDPDTKELTPLSITVTGKNGLGAQTFVRGLATDGAWLYALQAAKVGTTVYGIWLGHVYHYHVVTAAIVMTMCNNLPTTHPLFPMLDKPSQYLIEFDEVLLLTWRSVAPPTSITSGLQFLELLNTYAAGRKFFDDDPLNTLNNQGIAVEDFTSPNGQPWDRYPIAGMLLEVYQTTKKYVTAIVETTYATDAEVAADTALQAWMTDAGNPGEGNIQGLPTMNSKAALISVLTSYLYRITAHGESRLVETADSPLGFVSNFPPCLQIAEIPTPSTSISTEQLLKYLPKTGTIGEMIGFYFTFVFSAPYDSFIPVAGVDANLYFPGGTSDVRNQALIQFRNDISSFMEKFVASMQINPYPVSLPQFQQWPANIET